MTAAVLITLLAVGLAVGFLSGLIGIGGGVLIVPFLYFFYSHPRWSGATVPQDLATTVAHATSLAVIVPTALRGTYAYQKERLVAWRAALPIAAGSILAAIAGAILAVYLPARLLRLAFGLLLIGAGLQLVLRRSPPARHKLRLALPITLGTGALVGVFSALLGVGGGLIAIPMLIWVVGLELERVAATSLAVVACAATAGVATYMVTGGMAHLPGSVGYVHAIAAVPIMVGSLVSVRWGTRVNQRMDTRSLRLTFGAVFALFGIRLIWLQIIGQ